MAEEQGERKQWAAVEAAYEAALSWANYSGDFLSAEGGTVLRDLALAVAREIFKEHHPRLCGIWAAAYNDMLIEDIEALGKEA